jgi:hypothetical protein
MTKIDENLEVMAQIKMNVDTIDTHVKLQQSSFERDLDHELAPDHEEHEDETEETQSSHVAFGSAVPGWTASSNLPNRFDDRVRSFLLEEFDLQIGTGAQIQVRAWSNQQPLFLLK